MSAGLFHREPVTCLRPSSLSLDDKANLMTWKAANTLRGALHHEDILTRARLIKDSDWRAFKSLVREVDEREGGREASTGTTIHAVVGALVEGRDVDGVGYEFLADARACVDALEDEGIKVVLSEVNTAAIDVLSEGVAGTADGISDEGVVVDVKSTNDGDSSKWRQVGWSIQLSCYAVGLHHPGEFTRDRWGRPTVDPDDLQPWLTPLNREVGIVVEVGRGTGKARVHRVDLVKGLELAQLAIDVRSARKAIVLL